MAVQAGEAYIPVRADMSGFGKQVEQGTTKANGKIKGFAKSAGGMLAGAFAVSTVTNFFGTAAAAARESRAIANQTAQVIKTTGGAAKITAEEVGDLASAISKKTAVDDEAIQSGANLLLTFTNLRNEVGKGNNVFDQTVELANDMSVTLGQDMKSSSIQLGKALNDPIRGVSALQRVGVSFTAQQKEQIATLVESGRTLDAQKLILAELDTQFGGSAAAQADASKRMAVSWGNFQEWIGGLLIPVIDQALGWMTKLTDWAVANPAQFKTVAAVIGGTLVAALTAYTVAAIQASIASGSFTVPILAIGAAVAALAAGIIWAYENVGWFRDTVDTVARFVTRVVWPAIQDGVEVFRTLGRVAGSIFSTLKDVVRVAVRYVLDQLDRLLGPLDEIAGKIGGVVGKVGGVIGKIPGLADGGTVTRAGLTWVGEEGPELVRDDTPAELLALVAS